MIKGILLDYDGVMTKNNDANSPPSELLAKILDKSLKETNDLFMTFWPDYLRGKISDEEMWSLIEAKTDRKIPIDKRDIWSKWEQLHPLPEMIEFVASLQAQGYPIGLLTNVTPTTLAEVEMGGGYKGFDFLIQSCKVGYAKPEPEIYKLAVDTFSDLVPEEVLFVDDRERFLVPAQAMGMKTVLSLDSQQVITDVSALLRD